MGRSIQLDIDVTAAALLVAVPAYLSSALFLVLRAVLSLGPGTYTIPAAVVAVSVGGIAAVLFAVRHSLRQPYNGTSGLIYRHLFVCTVTAFALFLYYELYALAGTPTTVTGQVALGSMAAAIGILGLVSLLTPQET